MREYENRSLSHKPELLPKIGLQEISDEYIFR